MRSQHRVPADKRKQIWGLCFLIYDCNLLEASLRFLGVGRLFIATVSQASGSLLLPLFVSGQTRKEFEL